VFVGTMSYGANVDAATWFVSRILPRIRAQRPAVRLLLVGRGPNASVRRLARVPGVEITGQVPDVVPYLERATAFVAPLRVGGGFPNKVAEALAAGVPVVATSKAHAGIGGLVPGVHLLEADDEAAFAEQTLRALDDVDLRLATGRAGRRFMGAYHSWAAVTAELEALYLEITGAPRARRHRSEQRTATTG
jgi:glycosyltransferase involved in cell wall biosynthesis